MSVSTRESLPPIVTKSYNLVYWLLPRVKDFPHSYRFELGDRLIHVPLDLVESLVEVRLMVCRATDHHSGPTLDS